MDCHASKVGQSPTSLDNTVSPETLGGDQQWGLGGIGNLCCCWILVFFAETFPPPFYDLFALGPPRPRVGGALPCAPQKPHSAGHQMEDSGIEQFSQEEESGYPAKQSSRRLRINFSDAQSALLEATFQASHYPDQQLKKEIAKRLGIGPDRVTVWFQNRRSKWRRSQHQQQQHQSNGQIQKQSGQTGAAGIQPGQTSVQCHPPNTAADQPQSCFQTAGHSEQHGMGGEEPTIGGHHQLSAATDELPPGKCCFHANDASSSFAVTGGWGSTDGYGFGLFDHQDWAEHF